LDPFWTKPITKNPSRYFKENFVVTTSGMFSEPALAYTLSVLWAEKVLFAADYP
jgi:hypothetical protein